MSFDLSDNDEAYLDEIIQDAKNNPTIGIGMPVWVYDHNNVNECIGEGVIVSMYWNNYFCQYIVDVRGADCVYPCVMAACVEPMRRTYGQWIMEVVSNV